MPAEQEIIQQLALINKKLELIIQVLVPLVDNMTNMKARDRARDILNSEDLHFLTRRGSQR